MEKKSDTDCISERTESEFPIENECQALSSAITNDFVHNVSGKEDNVPLNENDDEGCIQPQNNKCELNIQTNVADNSILSSTPLLENPLHQHFECKSDPIYLQNLSSLNQLCQYSSDAESDNESGTKTNDTLPILSKDEPNVSEIVDNCLANRSIDEQGNNQSEQEGSKESEIIVGQEQEIQIPMESDIVVEKSGGNIELVLEVTDNEKKLETAVHTSSAYRRPEPEGASDSSESEEDSEDSSSSSDTSSSSEETTDTDSSDECVIVAQKKPDTQKRAPAEASKTRGEIGLEDLPPIEDLHITVPEAECVMVGHVVSIVESLVVVQALKGTPALDLDSVLFLEQGHQTLGRIFDVFGPVGEPCYAVRFNSQEHALQRGIEKGMSVFFAPRTEHSSFVFLADLMKMKGSDASWEHNNEPPPRYLDYSDDEEEMRARGKKKPPTREDDEAGQPDRKRRSSRGRGRGRRDHSAQKSPDRWRSGGGGGGDSRVQTPTWPPSRGSAVSPWASPCPSPAPYLPGPQPLVRPATFQVPQEPPPPYVLPLPTQAGPGSFYVNQSAGPSPGLHSAAHDTWATPPPFSGFSRNPPPLPPRPIPGAPHGFHPSHDVMGSPWGPDSGAFPSARFPSPLRPHLSSPPPRITSYVPPPPPPGW